MKRSIRERGLSRLLGVIAVSKPSEQERKRIKRCGMLVAVLSVVASVAIIFLSFCLMELFISIITGCLFSWIFPLLATVMVILTFIALVIVRGGNCE